MFQLDDLVRIVNPNHYSFGFEGKIIKIEKVMGESTKYTIGKTIGVTYYRREVYEYEIELIKKPTIYRNRL